MVLTNNLDIPADREATFKESELKKLEIKDWAGKIERDKDMNTCAAESCLEKPTHHVPLNLGGLGFHVLFCLRHSKLFDARHGLRVYGDVRQIDDYWDPRQNKFVMLCRDDGRQFHFYCQWCGKEHHHGNQEGHRIAHCNGPSPYKTTGYFLVKKPDKN